MVSMKRHCSALHWLAAWRKKRPLARPKEVSEKTPATG